MFILPMATLFKLCLFLCFWCVFTCLFCVINTGASDCLEILISEMTCYVLGVT